VVRLFSPSTISVIARFMRATQFFEGGRKMGRPDKPGHDEYIWREKNGATWVARIRGP
jgi:hypothetical protein